MAEEQQTITNPDEAIRRVLQGAKAEDVLAKCRINEVFERREWAQAANTFSTVLSHCPIRNQLSAVDLAIGIIKMCEQNRIDNVTSVG
jgi:hypothetical protein